jgi:hypothetical protein
MNTDTKLAFTLFPDIPCKNVGAKIIVRHFIENGYTDYYIYEKASKLKEPPMNLVFVALAVENLPDNKTCFAVDSICGDNIAYMVENDKILNVMSHFSY